MAMTAALPQRAGSRDEAREILQPWSSSGMAGADVRLDGHRLVAGSSSFMDELVKVVLEEGGASRLVLDGVTQLAADFATASAERRGVSGRLQTVVR